MGGNGAYIRSESGVPSYKRTHTDVGDRVDGHKVIVQTEHPSQIKTPMNSNSDNPTYLIAKVKDGKVCIESIAVYENHKLVETIDIVSDKNGNFVPYSSSGGSHSHKWKHNEDGNVGRKRHDRSNNLPIPSKYKKLIEDVINYNKSGRKWNK